MVREVQLCRTGGKACGQASVMLHWDDDSPLRRALTGYVQGRRPRPAPAPAGAATCPQSCVYGVCEQGACKCWKGARSSIRGPKSHETMEIGSKMAMT